MTEPLPSRKPRTALFLAGTAVVALAVGAVIGYSISAGASAGDAKTISALKGKVSTLTSHAAAVIVEKAKLDTEKAALDAQAAALKANTFDGDGTFIVGTDIQPGVYKANASPGCYWARLSDLSGTVDGIITNNNTDGPVVVRIAATDKAFTDARCGSFTKVG